MDTICYLQVPDNFEELYREYKHALSGAEQGSVFAEATPKDSLPPSKKRPTSGPLGFPRQSEIPSGTDWPAFTFQFLDKESVLVTVHKIKEKLNYADMGFRDNRKTEKWPPYDSQWQLLLDLAECGGEIEPSSSYAKPENEKAKEKLTNKLQQYFSVHYDPFWKVDSYKKGIKKQGSYKTRMTLIPPPAEKSTVGLEDPLAADIAENYADQTPLIGE